MTDTAVTPETLNIVLDGRQVEARTGELLIAAAERHGVYIPRFCYHPRMKPVGMCRMCLVEVKGPRGFQLQPACFIPVADGQEVVTNSPAVKKAQDGILEFLLVNHPLDCPVCDKGGECPLQDQTFAYGPGESRFVEEKRHWDKPIALSPLVLLDRERCIQCARCTRFAAEIAGDPQIDFFSRGERTEVAIFPGRPFSSYFSGNTVQICPVGALLATPYRFKARPWDLEQVESTCTTCAVGCRMAVQSSANELTRYLGIDSDPVNQSWLCDKGRFGYQAVNSSERLAHPLVKRGDTHDSASWSEALREAASGLERAQEAGGPTAVAVLGGARLANEDAYAWAKLAKGVLGTDNVDAQLGDGLPPELVLGLPRATISEAATARAVVLLAPDLKEELPVLYLRLRLAAVEGKVPLIEITPQATGLTPYARVTLLHRPGEAAAVAQALGGDGDDEVAGVSARALGAARELLRSAAGNVVVVLGRPSVGESPRGTADAAALLASMGSLASMDRGVKFLPALRRGNVHGALDMGLAPGVLPGRVSLDAGRRWFTEAWGGVPAERGLDAGGILTAAAAGRIQALVLLGADPLADFPDRSLARRALDAVPFVVAVDCFLTGSARAASVVLPAAAYSERAGTTTNLEGRITRLGQKITPPGVAWPDWMIASELAARLGADLGFTHLDGIWDEVERLAVSHAGITRRLLGSRECRDGVVAPLPPDLAAGDERPAGAAATDTGAGATAPTGMGPVDPSSDPGIDAVETQGIPAMAVAPPHEEQGPAVAAPGVDRPAVLHLSPGPPAEPPARDAYALRLIAGRRLYDNGVSVGRSPHLAPLVAGRRARVNPYELERLGIPSGGRVRLRSPRATLEVEADADPGVPRGAVALPFNVGREGAGGEGVGEQGAADLIDATATVNDARLESLE